MNKHIIFDNYDPDAYREGAIESLLENCDYSEAADIPESEIYEEINFLTEIYWDDERHMMENYFDGKMLLVCGNVGRWNGNFAAGKIIDYSELWKCWADCDYISIYDEGGHFYIEASHHDGTNCFEVKILTEKGAEIYDRWENYCSRWEDLNEREVHERLWKNAKYTHIPHYAREVFGCKTR